MSKELFKKSYEETEREKKEKWQAKGKIKLKLHHVDRIFQLLDGFCLCTLVFLDLGKCFTIQLSLSILNTYISFQKISITFFQYQF